MTSRERLTLAIETVVAVVVASLAFAWADLRSRLFAALAAAFLMQCDAGSTRGTRQRVLIAMGVAMILAVLLGTVSRPVPYLHDALVVITAFAVFWARAHTPGAPKFTTYVYTILVITGLGSIADPSTASSISDAVVPALRSAGAVAAGFAIAFVVRFYALPAGLTAALARLFSSAPTLTADASAPAASGPEATSRTWSLMPARAAIVALAAVLVSRGFHIERGYWVELSAVVLVNETFGESTKKSAERFAMTLSGCVTGWGLHHFFAESIWAQRAGLVASVFFAAYFRPVSYARMVFFVTVYVTFLFSLFGQWSTQVLVLRLEDTAIGCVLAIAGSLVIPRTISLARR